VPATLAKSAPAAKPEGGGAQPSAAGLLAWYDRHARVLPWRVGPAARRAGKRPDPYAVWLSEVMLQQTVVKAAAPYFLRFLARWPNVRSLAAAEPADIMAAWAGLGYYSRARSLIACAQAVAARPEARFPETAAELAKLPGIGPYTSAAIAAIAFGEPVAVVDGNVERVVSRLFAVGTPMPAGKTAIREALQPLVPRDRPGEFAEAVMDLGATICTPRKPACALCPWFDPCIARRQGTQGAFPVKAAKRERPSRSGAVFVARRPDGGILLRRRPPRGLLGGMSEVPGSEWANPAPAAVPPVSADWRPAGQVEHGLTHFTLTLAVHRAEVGPDTPAPAGCWWSAPAALPGEALPSVMKKVIEAAYPGATKPGR
jgi:A/G-specific adenine glycosylase